MTSRGEDGRPSDADAQVPREGPATQQGMARVRVDIVTGRVAAASEDTLAVEEPLEIRLSHQVGDATAPTSVSVSITMRTPGDDWALACGFLATEGIVRGRRDVANVRHCGPTVGSSRLRNVVRVTLRPSAPLDLARLQRHFYTSSSCGVCGKTSIAALHVAGLAPIADDGLVVDAAVLHGLPAALQQAQLVFGRTGGLHAAGLFDAAGVLRTLREDVGRHNAVDKVIGTAFLADELPLRARILLVSGRASFELVQKAVLAGIPVMAAVGAPSSLAVELAQRYGLTLVGFLRNQRFNIYSRPERVDVAVGH